MELPGVVFCDILIVSHYGCIMGNLRFYTYARRQLLEEKGDFRMGRSQEISK